MVLLRGSDSCFQGETTPLSPVPQWIPEDLVSGDIKMLSDQALTSSFFLLLLLDLNIESSGSGSVKLQNIECDHCEISTAQGASILQAVKVSVSHFVPVVKIPSAVKHRNKYKT